MERFKRTFSFKKKKDHVPEASKPHQWQEDEKKVRDATCSFQVRYLGYIEVFESRGIQVCEEAVKALKSRQNRSVWSRMSLRKKKSKADQQCKGKYQRAILYVSGDALRVVDEISKGLIVDQTIEKVSFCAPDRNQEKGFAYICRDGTTRRWMCHGFLAVKESGERLSHAVGCAFAICLEKKQKREKDAVTVTYNDKGTTFSRMGSFRQATLTERMQDPQSVILTEPVEQIKMEVSAGGGIDNSVAAVQRPKPSEEMLQRQASFRGFSKLGDNSPFKRQMSLRLNELPSNLARQDQLKQMGHSFPTTNGGVVEAIAEVSPSKESDHLSDLRQQIEGLSAALSTNAGGQNQNSATIPNVTTHTSNAQPQQPNTSVIQQQAQSNTIASTGKNPNIPSVEPIRQTNPWETPPAFRHNSPAESWLQSATVTSTPPVSNTPVVNGGGGSPRTIPPARATAVINTTPQRQPVAAAPMMSSQPRSQTIDTADLQWYNQQKAPTLRELQQRNQLANFQSASSSPPQPQHQITQHHQQQQLLQQQQQQQQQVTPPPKLIQAPVASVHIPPRQQAIVSQSSVTSTSSVGKDPWSVPLGPTTTDPFDAAWATKSPNTKQVSSNPFHPGGDAVSQTFKMQL